MKCCLCGNETENQWGHNPYPVTEKDSKERCCAKCNESIVVPARMKGLKGWKSTTTFKPKATDIKVRKSMKFN